MEQQDEREKSDEALDDEALEQVSGGSVAVGHELTHTTQQSTSVGSNETITISVNRTESV